MMTRTTRAALYFVAGLAIVGGAWLWTARRPAQSYFDKRRLIILAHARHTANPVVVLGDNIVEIADLRLLCGNTVLNAGIAGANIAGIEALSRDVLAIRRPKLVIVALGLNDARRGAAVSNEDFLEKYRAIVARARMAGAAVRVSTIPPIGAIEQGSIREYDRDRIEELNGLIRTIGVPVLDVHAALANNNGFASAAWTDDGVHPNARGYGIWKQVMAQACAL